MQKSEIESGDTGESVIESGDSGELGIQSGDRDESLDRVRRQW